MRIAISLLLSFIMLATVACSRSGVIATVNTEKITVKEFEALCGNKALLLGVDSLSDEQRRAVLESLVQREIIYLYAKEHDIQIPEERLQEAMNDISFIDKLRFGKGIEKNLYLEATRKRMAGFIRIDDDEVRKYYHANPEEFTEPERYRVYLVMMKEQDADHVLRQVAKKPEAFDDMALKTSSPGLIKINENAPYAPKDDFPESMWPYLETMKVGDIGGPVEAERGIFIFKLVDKKPPSLLPLSEVYMGVEHTLLSEKQDAAFEALYEKIKGNYAVTINDALL